LPTAPIQPELWTMYFDGSLMKTGAGAGLLFISPLGKHVRYVLLRAPRGGVNRWSCKKLKLKDTKLD
jgi:hypothetical protein